MKSSLQKESLLSFVKDDFTFVDLIGKGSFGQVYKCIHKVTGLTVAIKTIDLEKAEDDIDDIQREINILGQCDCPNITKYFSSKIVSTQLWIVMEYLGGGSAYDILQFGEMEEVFIATIIKEVLKGLVYLHGEFKIHRDIKSANILLADSGHVKLADFGVAGQISDTFQKRNTFVGTPFWMAPEVIKQSDYDFKADIWSLGVTVYEMAKAHPPHHELHPMKALFAICKENAPELDPSFSKNIRDFVSLCLNKDPEFRPAAKILLKHKFVKNAKKTNILIDLIEKTKLKKMEKKMSNVNLNNEGQIDNVDPNNDNMNTVKPNSAPDWVFETIKVAKDMMVLISEDGIETVCKESAGENNPITKPPPPTKQFTPQAHNEDGLHSSNKSPSVSSNNLLTPAAKSANPSKSKSDSTGTNDSRRKSAKSKVFHRKKSSQDSAVADKATSGGKKSSTASSQDAKHTPSNKKSSKGNPPPVPTKIAQSTNTPVLFEILSNIVEICPNIETDVVSLKALLSINSDYPNKVYEKVTKYINSPFDGS